MNRLGATMVAAALAAPLAAFAQNASPLTETKGRLVEPPCLDAGAFETGEALEAVAVPLDGWKVAFPTLEGGREVVSGIEVFRTNAVVRGAVLPALRLVCTHGDFPNDMRPVVELDWPFNAMTHNVLSFIGKVEVDDGLLPLTRDSQGINTGWFSDAFSRYFDTFGVAVDDGHAQWCAWGVPTTHFHFHDFPASRGPDGYADFAWDMRYQDHTGNKGFALDRARALRFFYDTRKIPEGKKVVVTIAMPRLVKGAHIAFDEPDRYAAWTNWVASYEPDYSDSSALLGPPETGRIARPVRLVENGEPRAEIVVDYSEALRIDNFFPDRSKWNPELRMARGYEVPVARRATQELADWIEKITGARLPVVLRPTPGAKARIYLGATFAKPHFGGDLAALAAGPATDGYAIRARGDDLYIFGARPAGTLFGVYAFLENNTDLIWANADPLYGTVYTERPTLDVVWADVISKPAFIQRGCSGPVDWRIRNSMNFPGDPQYGMSPVQGGHMLSPQYYDAAEGLKKFNAMINGKRPEQWNEYVCLACLSDPEFIEHSSECVPNVRHIRYTCPLERLVVGTDDNYGVCECPLCTRPYTNAAGRVISPETDYSAHYGIWFYDYLNRLDDRIQKVWPGFITSTFAYFFAAPYPEIPVNKTISPQLCLYVRKYMNEPVFAPQNQHWWKYYRQWIAHSENLMNYDYWALGFFLKPHADVHKFDLQAMREIGYLRSYSEGFGGNEYLGAAGERWAMARLDWDPDQDAEQLHRRYNRRAYREAAPWMDKFRGTIREAVYKRGNRGFEFEETHDMANIFRDLGIVEELRGYLEEAVKAARHPASKALCERALADFDHYVVQYKEPRDFPSIEMNKKAQAEAVAARGPAEDAWSRFGNSRTDFDGIRAVRGQMVGERRQASFLAPAFKAAESQAVLTFAAPDWAFALSGPPSVACRDGSGADAPCESAWRRNGDGTWTVTIRPPADVLENGRFVFTEAPVAEGMPAPASVELRLVGIALEKRAPGDLPKPPAADSSAAARLVADATRATTLLQSAKASLSEINGHAPDFTAALPALRALRALQAPDGSPAAPDPVLFDLFRALLATGSQGEFRQTLANARKGLDDRPCAEFQILRSAVAAAATSGDEPLATELLRDALDDRRVDDSHRMACLNADFLVRLIASPRPIPPDRAAALIREFGDDRSRLLGWTPPIARYGFVERFTPASNAYAARGDYAAAARLWELAAAWDGNKLPCDLRLRVDRVPVAPFRRWLADLEADAARKAADLERSTAEEAALEKPSPQAAQAARAAVAKAKAALAEAGARRDRCKAATGVVVERWKKTLRDVVTDGSDAHARGSAVLALLDEEWDARTPEQRKADLDKVAFDEYMRPEDRRDATMRIPRLYSAPASTNWGAAADHVAQAVESGDWSNNGRNSYHRSRKNDFRLDVVEAVARPMVAQGQAALAKGFAERCLKALGYFEGTTNADEPGTGEADWKARADRVDALLKDCGGARPPKPGAAAR